MAFEQRDNSGAMFKNDKEGGNPNWPDYKGNCMIDGVGYWMSAWVKDGKNGGKKFMSFSFKRKDVATKPKLKVVGGVDDAKPEFDDEIPF